MAKIDTRTEAVEYELWLSFGRATGGICDVVRALTDERNRMERALEHISLSSPEVAQQLATATLHVIREGREEK